MMTIRETMIYDDVVINDGQKVSDGHQIENNQDEEIRMCDAVTIENQIKINQRDHSHPEARSIHEEYTLDDKETGQHHKKRRRGHRYSRHQRALRRAQAVTAQALEAAAPGKAPAFP